MFNEYGLGLLKKLESQEAAQRSKRAWMHSTAAKFSQGSTSNPSFGLFAKLRRRNWVT